MGWERERGRACVSFGVVPGVSEFRLRIPARRPAEPAAPARPRALERTSPSAACNLPAVRIPSARPIQLANFCDSEQRSELSSSSQKELAKKTTSLSSQESSAYVHLHPVHRHLAPAQLDAAPVPSPMPGQGALSTTTTTITTNTTTSALQLHRAPVQVLERVHRRRRRRHSRFGRGRRREPQHVLARRAAELRRCTAKKQSVRVSSQQWEAHTGGTTTRGGGAAYRSPRAGFQRSPWPLPPQPGSGSGPPGARRPLVRPHR